MANPAAIRNILGIAPDPEQHFYDTRQKQFSATFTDGMQSQKSFKDVSPKAKKSAKSGLKQKSPFKGRGARRKSSDGEDMAA